MSRGEWEPERRAEIATRRAVMARDAGLRRISIVTRWMIAGVVGLSGGLALIAANAFHGRTITSGSSTNQAQTTPAQTTPATTTPATTTPATTTPATTTPATTTPATTTPATTTPAATTPSPTPAAPVVVSGGS